MKLKKLIIEKEKQINDDIILESGDVVYIPVKQLKEEYNGWKNYETWNVYTWVTNEERTQKIIRKYVGNYDAKKAEQITKQIFPKGTPDFDSVNDYKKVDWQEVADAYNEGV